VSVEAKLQTSSLVVVNYSEAFAFVALTTRTGRPLALADDSASAKLPCRKDITSYTVYAAIRACYPESWAGPYCSLLHAVEHSSSNTVQYDTCAKTTVTCQQPHSPPVMVQYSIRNPFRAIAQEEGRDFLNVNVVTHLFSLV
jgi:hypothetical protein